MAELKQAEIIIRGVSDSAIRLMLERHASELRAAIEPYREFRASGFLGDYVDWLRVSGRAVPEAWRLL